MIRNAVEADIARLVEIRNGVAENKLSDPAKVTVDDYRWFIANPGIIVWEEVGRIVGFSAADLRDGSIWALFVDQAFERRGIGQALFERAVAVLKNAGFTRLRLTTDPQTRAESFYRAAGWDVVGEEGGEIVFERTISL